jgi:hypothetical protein
MRSWVYYIELLAHKEGGRTQSLSAVYVVALPEEEELSKVSLECYATEYAPIQLALNHGKAYAVGVDWEPKDLKSYRLKGFREDLELYVFEEGLSFKEGLVEVYRLLLSELGDKTIAVEPLIDVGSPPKELLFECLKKALSA